MFAVDSPIELDAGGALSCLTDDEILAFLHGEPIRAAYAVHEHLDQCELCRVLLGEAAQQLGVDPTEEEATSSAARRRTLAPGNVVSGRYEIVRFVASGGMGEVYEARDNVLNVIVALKTLIATALDDGSAVSRLMAEVRLARQVTHPNVCRILEFGVHEPTRSQSPREPIPFLTMEFLRGETLERRLSSKGRFEQAEVRRLLEQMLAGLWAMHSAGIVHRDLKPANVLVLDDPTDRVVLMDFGLARAVDPIRGASGASGRALVGTVAYMAPEQVAGKPATVRFDIYALGLVLFEMLTGTKPFPGDTAMASAVERLTRPPPRPSQFAAGLDPVWDEIVTKCLALDPAKRFGTIDEIAACLSAERSRARWWPLWVAAAATAIGTTIVATRGGAAGRSSAVAASSSWLAEPRQSVPDTDAQQATKAGDNASKAAPSTPLAEATTPHGAATMPSHRPKGARAPVAEPAPSRFRRVPTDVDEVFRPRPARPSHPDDVINPFE